MTKAGAMVAGHQDRKPLMGSCCHGKEKDLEKTAQRHRRDLWLVLIINVVMFAVEMTSGILSGSLALVADSLDMLGDSVTYGSSLVVVGMATSKKAQVARLKAWIMLIFGLTVSAKCIYRGFNPVMPEFGVMIGVGLIALAANLVCLVILTKSRDDDINMRSVWICSRNDIVANTSVLAAALGVHWLKSPLPDILVGVLLAVLFTWSASNILREVQKVKSSEQLNNADA